jgi:hypothetical protein
LKNWHRDTPSAPVMPYNTFIHKQTSDFRRKKMKLILIILKYLLQVPLLSFLVIGVDSITNGNLWISALVTISALFLYTTGEYLETKE